MTKSKVVRFIDGRPRAAALAASCAILFPGLVEFGAGRAAADPGGRSALGLFSDAPPAAPGPARPAHAARDSCLDSLVHQRTVEDDLGVGPLALLAISSCCNFCTSAADDFTLDADATIARIGWDGVYYGAALDHPGPDAHFRITIYEDNGAGNVGAVVMDRADCAVTKSLHDRIPIFGTHPVYSFISNLSPPLSLHAGTRYWISINGDPDGVTGPTFGWMASPEGDALETPEHDQPLQNRFLGCDMLPAPTFTPGSDIGLDVDLAFSLLGARAAMDCNSDGVPDACDCPIDLTNDLRVDALDLTELLGSWGPAQMPGCRADIDADGVIGARDLSLLLGAWGACR